MALFIHKDSSLELDDSNLGLNETPLIEKLWSLLKQYGYDLVQRQQACTHVPTSGTSSFQTDIGEDLSASISQDSARLLLRLERDFSNHGCLIHAMQLSFP